MKLFSRTPKPPLNVELSDKNKKLRVILLCITITVAIVAFSIGISSLLSIEKGWHEIEVNSSDIHCGEDFVFNYYFDDKGTPTSEYRNVCGLYSKLATDAYWMFSAENNSDGRYNPAYINSHINETVKVDSALYEAFELFSENSSRALYLGPIYSVYDDLCFSEDEVFAKMKDPTRNSDVAEYFADLICFIQDPSHIELTLLGENQVLLTVSDEYLAFAEENGIDVFLDLGWMKNAFIIDYMASALKQNGYTNGYISSYDGFTRNLDVSGKGYSLNIIDRLENSAYPAAVLNYSGETAIVFLRNYPLSQKDVLYYYSWSDGVITTHYIDPSDGYSKSSTDNMVAYGSGVGCAEILLRMCPVYIADSFDESAARAMTSCGIYAIWFEGTKLYTSGDSTMLKSLYKDENIEYILAE